MRIRRTIALALATVLVACVLAPAAKAEVGVSFGFFYSNLRPYGSWLVSADYGRVWQPAAYAPGWNPYYDGHWVSTDLGWTWVSDYAWGGVPYHYGTWVLDPRFGWVWVPGYTWAPSWVVFRTSPKYIGWAPVPPRYTLGASFAFGQPDLFVFVSSRDFLAPRIRARAFPAYRTRNVLRSTRIVNRIAVENHVVVNRGPDVRFVERATGRRIAVTPIERVRRVGPSDRITRADLRVTRDKGRLRAAEPVRIDKGPARGEPASLREDRRSPVRVKAEPKRSSSERAMVPSTRRQIDPPSTSMERPSRPPMEQPQRAKQGAEGRKAEQRAAPSEHQKEGRSKGRRG